jgi:hypothetical protein
MLLIRPARALGWAATTLVTLVTYLRICVPSVRDTPFFLHSPSQVPQSDLGPIPAACLLKDYSQVILDYWFWCMKGCCNFAVRTSLRNKRSNRPFFACEICVFREQPTPPPVFIRASSTAPLRGNWVLTTSIGHAHILRQLVLLTGTVHNLRPMISKRLLIVRSSVNAKSVP